MVKPRALNTLRHRVVAPLGAIAGLLVMAMTAVGCGGSGSPGVSSVLRQAFHPSTPIRSGKVDLSFGLAATGLASVSQPFSLRVQGPFESQGSGQLPRFDLSVTLNGAGRSTTVGATATGRQLFVKLQGVPFVAPDSVYQQFKQGYAQSSAAAGAKKGQTTFASLGIDPSGWLSHPRQAGGATVGGADTVHVVSGLDVPRFLNDLGRVSSTGNNLGLGAGLSAAQRAALSRSVTSARVDVYAGRSDHVLRRLTVHAALAARADASSALGGLKTGTLDLTLAFSDVNQPQAISAPANAQPLSKLTGLAGALSGATGGTGSAGSATAPSVATPAPSASGQQAYIQCATTAGQNVAALQRCASLLSGG
jgi:hypothetical protein